MQPAAPLASGIISGRPALLQTGISGSIPHVNAMYTLDSRQQNPSTWDEVNLLQEALQPSIRTFSRITARPPPSIPDSPWLSYASQLEILQRESDRLWSADRRPGAPPELAGLAAWRGGILMVGKAEFHITEEMTEGFIHARLRGKMHGWHQDQSVENKHDEFQSILLAADSRREKLRAQVVETIGQQDVSENTIMILDNIVARDPERYLAWLSTMGYFYFMTNDHNPYAFSWEKWCTWIAPKSFEFCSKQASVVRRPPIGPGSIDRSKYGPPGDRPTISLEEAKAGNRRALDFRYTAIGMEVSQEEKAQYCIISGEAMSREAAAHYRAIGGEDIWLLEPINSIKEAYDDPSREREVEVEAAEFRCWQWRCEG